MHLRLNNELQIRYKLPSKRNHQYEKNTDIFNRDGKLCCFLGGSDRFNYYTPGTDNYNSTIHGFYLGLGSSSLAPSDSSSPSSLSGEIRLDSFTLRGAANNLGANVTYGFLVLMAPTIRSSAGAPIRELLQQGLI